jgi:membrane associated rhomboid family serine protease
MIGIWFVIQIFDQVGSVADVQSAGGVAYAAHIGGCLFGILTGRFFERSERPYQW